MTRRTVAGLEDEVFSERRLITGYEFKRFSYAYPVMTPGAYSRLPTLHQLNDDSRLILAGDYMIYPTFEAAADSGELAAEYAFEMLE